jgi:hypothetical protein
LEPGGAVIWEAFRAGWGSWWAGGCGCLLPGWCLSRRGRAPVVPHGAGAQHGLMGRDLVIPHIAGAQQGLKGGGLGGWGRYPRGAVGLAPSWGSAPMDGRDSGGRGSGGRAEGWVFRRGVCLAWCGSLWCFTSVRRVSSFSAGPLGQLMRSVALSRHHLGSPWLCIS